MVKNSLQSRSWVDSPGWFWTFIVASIACVAAYVANLIFSEVNPGNVWGLTYGSIATILMVGAALYGLRRRTMKISTKLGLGRAQSWVQYHIYGGTIFLLLVFMHSGFSLPSGPLNWLLWILSIWVTLSGIFGIILQKWIPKILASGLSVEIVYERIPELVEEMRANAEEVIKKCAEPLKDFYARNIQPALGTPKTRLIYYVDITGGIQTQLKQFEYLERVLSNEDKQKLQSLESIYKTKLELDAHYTLQKALRVWLYAHVPLSLILLVAVALHLYAVYYY